MRLLVTLQVVAASFASQLDLSLRSLEKTPGDLCDRGATVANLCGNNLRQVPPCCATFQGLFIYRNQLERLPVDWLIHCPQIEALSVSDNRLESLPAGLFSGASRLRSFQASRNLLQTLPTGLFHNTHQLQQLDLSNNKLEILPPDLLHNTSRMSELFLQGNLLSFLPDDLLNSTARLRKLWLSHNALRALSAVLLSHCPHLRTLHLEYNVIEFVALGAFDSNEQLTFVDLSHNKITALPPGLFAKSASLKRLLLNDNKLSVIDPPTGLPRHQLLVDLSTNRLQRVDDLEATFGQAVVRLDDNTWQCDCRIVAVQRAETSPQRHRWFRGRQHCHGHPAGRMRVSEEEVEACFHSEDAAAARSGDRSQAEDLHPHTTNSSLDAGISQSITLLSTTSVNPRLETNDESSPGATTWVRNLPDASPTPEKDSTGSAFLFTGNVGSSSSESNIQEVAYSDTETDDYEYGAIENE